MTEAVVIHEPMCLRCGAPRSRHLPYTVDFGQTVYWSMCAETGCEAWDGPQWVTKRIVEECLTAGLGGLHILPAGRAT